MTLSCAVRILPALFLLPLLSSALSESIGASCNVDICVAYDSSASFSESTFEAQKDFIAGEDGVLDTISEAADGESVRIAAVQFSTTAFLVSALSSDVEEVAEAVQSSKFTGGLSNIGDAIRTCAGQLSNNKRARVIMLLADGLPGAGDLEQQVIASAQVIKNSGVSIVPVGIGGGINENFLNAIASGNPPSFFKKSFEGLTEIVTSVTAKICTQTVDTRPVATPIPPAMPPPFVEQLTPTPEDLFTPTPEVIVTPTPEDVVTPTPEVPDNPTTPRRSPNGNGSAGPSVTLTESPSPEELTETPSPEELTETPSPERFTETPSPDGVDVGAEPQPAPAPRVGLRRPRRRGGGYYYYG